MTPNREPPLEAIVLAAGAGARFGGGKLLARFGNDTVIGAALRAAIASPSRSVWVVVGCDAEPVQDEARRAATKLGALERTRMVHAADWRTGMAASLRAGLAALPDDTEGAFVFLGDMPRVPTSIAPKLARVIGEGALVACPAYEGQRGHPALIRRRLFPELAVLSGDQGARAVLDRLGERLALVETEDPGVLQDVDTPGDLVRVAAV